MKQIKKTFFHIGPHKTGSTYIQETLFNNREILALNGITYSSELVVNNSGHHGLYDAVLAKDRYLIENFCSSLSDFNIISSENFVYLNIIDLNYLFSFFEDHDIYVILFKRKYAHLLISAWQEYVKHGGLQPSYEYILSQILEPHLSIVLNTPNVIDRWVNNNFVHGLKIFNYDCLLSQNIDIAKAMIDYIVGHDLEGVYYDGRIVNASIDFKKIEIIRVFNKIAISSGLQINDNLRNSFLALMNQQPESIQAALDSTVFSYGELKISNSWAISILEEEFLNRYEHDRITNHHDKNNIMPQIEVGENGCYSVDLMNLYAKVILNMTNPHN